MSHWHLCHLCHNTSSVSNQYHNVSARTFVKRAKWDKASDIDIEQYKSSLSEYLNDIYVPYDSLRCSSHHCSDHNVDIDNYCNCIIDACLQSSRLCIPHSKNKGLAGWNEYMVIPPDRRRCFGIDYGWIMIDLNMA